MGHRIAVRASVAMRGLSFVRVGIDSAKSRTPLFNRALHHENSHEQDIQRASIA